MMTVKITEPTSTYGSNEESVLDTTPQGNNSFIMRRRTLENNSTLKGAPNSEPSELLLQEAS
jgi:hypothetical protein